MAKIYIPAVDEQFTRVLREKGLNVPSAPHWIVARLALAKSLQLAQFPDEELAKPLTKERGLEIHMEQLTGENTPNPDTEDYTDSFRLLLSMYHQEDLFVDRSRFIELLQRHIQRGMNEIKASWREGNDFHDYLFQELFFERAVDEPRDGEEATERIRSALGEIGVNATIDEVSDGPRLTRYLLQLTSPADLDRLRKDIDKIPFQLGIQQAVTLQSSSGERRIALDVPRPERNWHPVDGAMIPDWVKAADGALPVSPGVDVLGSPIIFDLAETPHLFVAGTTGSGKSVCLHAILLSLMSSGRKVSLALIDPKEVEFMAYEKSKFLWGGKVVTEVNEAAKLLSDMVAEMDRRQSVLASLGVVNITEAQAKGSDLVRIVVVIDELADILLQRPETEETIVRLAQKARAAGIHLLLSTQRPDAKTFTGLLRSNVPSRIAMTVRTNQDSRIILDETGAEKLLMRGDMLIRLAGEGTKRCHGAQVNQGHLRPWL
jgi:S-DNA-T family DNA segregation ATPase FtsK/SpoIIIE